MNFYDILFEKYDPEREKEEMKYLDSLDSSSLFKEIKTLTNKRILEIGAGTGRITGRILDTKPKKLVCIETSKKAISVLKNKFPDLKLVKSLKETNDKFDAIIIVHTLLHIEKKKNFLRNLTEVLKTDGKIIISELFQKDPMYLLDPNGNKIFQEIYPNDLEELKKIILQSNFKIMSEEIIVVDKSKIPPFEKSDLGKPLTFFWVFSKEKNK